MIVTLLLCFSMTRGLRGSRGTDNHGGDTAGAALHVLNKHYTQGESSREEYEGNSVIHRHS